MQCDNIIIEINKGERMIKAKKNLFGLLRTARNLNYKVERVEMMDDIENGRSCYRLETQVSIRYYWIDWNTQEVMKEKMELKVA